MALPSLTAQERADALAKAAAARVRRAQVKADLKSGKLKLSEVLDSAEEDEAITRMKVVALLQALPRVGLPPHSRYSTSSRSRNPVASRAWVLSSAPS